MGVPEPRYKIIGMGEVKVLLEDYDSLLIPSLASFREKVEVLWAHARHTKPSLFNGRVLHGMSCGQEDNAWVIKGVFIEYKYWFAQLMKPSWNLGIHPVKVSGITICLQDNTRYVMFGRRSDTMEYPGCWELVPSGNIDPSALGSHSMIDAKAQLIRVFCDETGLSALLINQVKTLGVLFDTHHQMYDVCSLISIVNNKERIASQCARLRKAYINGVLIGESKLDAFSLTHRDSMVPTSQGLLELYRKREDD